jgi:hypothetical protein
VFRALSDNDYGQYDDLISVLTPALGPDGLRHLKSRMLALSGQPVSRASGQIGKSSATDQAAWCMRTRWPSARA